MRVRILPIIFLVSVLLFLSGCSGDPNEEANKLYTEASQFMQSSKTEDGSYSVVFDLYERAKNRIDRILSRYPSSNIAVELLSGNIKISGFTLSQFQELEGSLKLLVEAEQFPLSCAILVTKTIENASFKVWALAEIAGKYTEAGQNEQAAQLLSQALQSAETIEIAPFKAWALADIAGKYAEAGQFSQALQTAKTIEDAYVKAGVLVEIAVKYAEAEEQSSEKDRSILRDITHTTHPMSQFGK